MKHAQPIVFFIRSYEGQTIETSALETLYGGLNYIITSVDKTKIYCRGTTRNIFLTNILIVKIHNEYLD